MTINAPLGQPDSGGQPGDDTASLAPGTTTRPPLSRVALIVALAVGVALGLLVGAMTCRPVSTPGLPPPPAAAPPAPSAAPEAIVFSAQDQRPEATPTLLDAGLPVVYLFFDLPAPPGATRPIVNWTANGRALTQVRPEDVTEEGRHSRGRAALRAPGGSLAPGVYEGEVRMGDVRVTGSFQTAWGASQILAQRPPAAVEVNMTAAALTNGINPDGSPLMPLKQIRDGSKRLFFVFRYENAEAGTGVTVKWFTNDLLLADANREVALRSSSGWAYAWVQVEQGLPAGGCRAVAYLTGDDAEMIRAEAVVVAPGRSPGPP